MDKNKIADKFAGRLLDNFVSIDGINPAYHMKDCLSVVGYLISVVKETEKYKPLDRVLDHVFNYVNDSMLVLDTAIRDEIRLQNKKSEVN